MAGELQQGSIIRVRRVRTLTIIDVRMTLDIRSWHMRSSFPYDFLNFSKFFWFL